MTFPVRVSIVTYNLWNNERWPDRARSLAGFLDVFAPDVLAVQELVPETRDFLDTQLRAHARVDDAETGWGTESNIWWRSDFFDEIEHGAADFGCTEYANRRVFWVRLAPRHSTGTFVVATVHLTDFGTRREIETGESPRVREAQAVAAALTSLVADGEPAFVVGDFNDAFGHLVPLLMAGYTSSYGALRQIPPMTLPASLDRFGGGGFSSAFVLDWILANPHARALATASPHFYVDDLPPSDHWPVHAVYELRGACATVPAG